MSETEGLSREFAKLAVEARGGLYTFHDDAPVLCDWYVWDEEGRTRWTDHDFDGWPGFGIVVDEMRRRGFDVTLSAWSPERWTVDIESDLKTYSCADNDPCTAVLTAAVTALRAEAER